MRLELLRDLIPHLGRKAWIEPPFFCDYGTQLHLGEGVFLNTGCVILDVAPVRIFLRDYPNFAQQPRRRDQLLTALFLSAGLASMLMGTNWALIIK